MTIQELKVDEDYYFECNIEKERILKEIENTNYFDEWGCAFVSVGEELGVEYNLCIDNTTDECENCSAIYKVDYNEKTKCIETDYSTFIHYEIDFNNPEWMAELENAMCKALIDFFKW